MSGLKSSGLFLGVIACVAAIGVVHAGQGKPQAVATDHAADHAKGLAGQAPVVRIATALLLDTENRPVGGASFVQETDGVLVKAHVAGMGAGQYGFHIHTTGKCDAPDFASAGGHWNPTGHHHGKKAEHGPHLGDLDNIVVAASGIGTLEQKLKGVRLADGAHPMLDADGASLMLHAGPDDYKSDPAGNSGPRIGCGQITPRG